jgi:RNA recognition motif-containing protein
MRMFIYVGGLVSHDDREELARLFAAYGRVESTKVFMHPDIFHREGGFGLVEMQTKYEAHRAIHALHNSKFHGRMLEVRAATAAENCAQVGVD